MFYYCINYLLYVQKPEPFTDVVKQLKDTKAIYNVKAACNDFLGKLNLISNDARQEDK